MFDTIAVISSGFINQPISIIRVSGTESINIVQKIFSKKIDFKKRIYHGFILDNDKKVDEVLLFVFNKNQSFTGEIVVEINAHGGVVNTNRILKLILANGARMAKRGEFLLRAFLNKKIDLVKAEAINDLIFAKTEEQAKAFVKKFDSHTSLLIEKLTNQLLEIIGAIEVNIDYPEYDDVQQLTTKTLIPKLEIVKDKLKEIINSSKSSQYIFKGIKVAIVGVPNVGKSSLLNLLLSKNKAIVSKIPGTTRDIVEGQVQINQILFHFSDTAGIQNAKDKLEKLGIKKTYSAIKESDLIIHLCDLRKKFTPFDKEIKEKSKNKKYIMVYNKKDLLKSEVPKNSISVKNNDIAFLVKEIKKTFKKIDLNNEKIINNTRQLSLIKSAYINVKQAIKSLKEKHTPDTVIIDIREVWKNLSNILGKAIDDTLIKKMFQKFCLGK